MRISNMFLLRSVHCSRWVGTEVDWTVQSWTCNERRTGRAGHCMGLDNDNKVCCRFKVLRLFQDREAATL